MDLHEDYLEKLKQQRERVNHIIMLDVKIRKVLFLKRATVREGSPTHQ